MKKLNLDETWRLCINQHRWIERILRHNDLDDTDHVERLKDEWMTRHGFSNIYLNCFFVVMPVKIYSMTVIDALLQK